MMRRLVMSAASAVMVTGVLVGCEAPPPPPDPMPTASTSAGATGDGVLKVGTIFPTTGTFAFLGAAQVAGVATAVKEINDAGGVNGVPVEVLNRDSADASTAKSEESFADLVTNAADVVIGPSSSVQAERLIPLAADAKVTLISPAATFPGLSLLAGSDFFFRTVPSYGQQGTVIGQVISEGDPKKVALVYINDELGKAVVPTLTESITTGGSSVVASLSVPSTMKDYAPLIADVKESAPDAVVLITAYSSVDTTKALISQLIAAGFGGSKLWLTTQNTGDYSQALPGGLLKDVNGIIEGFETDDAFKARLKQSDPNLTQFRYAAEAYDATILAALAAIVAGDDSGASIAASLVDVSKGGIKCTSFSECIEVLKTGDDIDYDGIAGPVNFTIEHDVSPAFYGLYVFNGENKFVFARGIVAG